MQHNRSILELEKIFEPKLSCDPGSVIELQNSTFHLTQAEINSLHFSNILGCHKKRIYLLSRKDRIKKQLEFWLKLSNFNKDEFLKSHSQKGGWIPISILLGFERFKAINVTHNEVVEAVASSHLICSNDQGSMITRYPLEQQVANIIRSFLSTKKWNDKDVFQKLMRFTPLLDITNDPDLVRKVLTQTNFSHPSTSTEQNKKGVEQGNKVPLLQEKHELSCLEGSAKLDFVPNGQVKLKKDKYGQTVLDRIFLAQNKAGVYGRVLDELKNGKKETHWIWYIFPSWSVLRKTLHPEYLLDSLFDAKEYLKHPVLSTRLLECTQTVSAHLNPEDPLSLSKIFNFNVEKFVECMTLFLVAAHQNRNPQHFEVFSNVLKQGFKGFLNTLTIKSLIQTDLCMKGYENVISVEDIKKLTISEEPHSNTPNMTTLLRTYLSDCLLLHSPLYICLQQSLLYPSHNILSIEGLRIYLTQMNEVFQSLTTQALLDFLEQEKELNPNIVVDQNGTVILIKPLQPQRSLLRFSARPFDSGKKFTLMNYNVLADVMCTAEKFPATKSTCLKWDDFRFPALKAQLKYYHPDLLFLQEVQYAANVPYQHLESYWKPLFKSLNYHSYSSEKKSKRPTLNLSICWNKNVFKVVEKMWVRFADFASQTLSNFPKVIEEMTPHKHVMVYALMHYKVNDSLLFIATCHLSADKEKPHLSILQGLCLLQYLEKLKRSYEGKYNRHIPLLLGGDFNSEPTSELYSLIEGSCSTSQISFFKNDPTIKLDWKCSLNLASAYKVGLGREPEFTTFCQHYTGTLDYIFFSKLLLQGILEPPVKSDLNGSMPNSLHPSDHLPLLAEFQFI